jgi:hypothetical protein
MDAKWYYAENGNSVGPLSAEEIADRIRQAENQSHFVWTEGMPGWADARTAPEFSTQFQAVATKAETGAEKKAIAAKAAKLAQRAWSELIEYLLISAYLYVCFGALIFYKTAILRSEGIAFAPYGLAIVKALILGKFILVLQTLKVGEGDNIVVANILKKSLLFTVLLVVLNTLEEVIMGYFHGRGAGEILSEMTGPNLTQTFATSALVFLILVPYFAYLEIAACLGEGELRRLLIARRSRERKE